MIDPHRSLAALHPHLLGEWDPDGEGGSPWEVAPGTHKRLAWRHEMPDGTVHRWTSTGGSRALLGAGCGVCRGLVVMRGVNDLATLRPDLAAEWCGEHNNRGPETVTAGSKHRPCWMCATCAFHWRTNVHARTKTGAGCARCAGQTALPGDPNTLALARPDLYRELDRRRLSREIDPRALMVASNLIVPWRCRHCNHGWETTPNSRSSAGTGCPACSKRTSAVERDLLIALRRHWPDAVGSASLRVAWNSGAPIRGARRRAEADVFVPSLGRGLVVEYDGLVSHRAPDRVRVDIAKTTALLAAGYRVIRVRENALPLLPLVDEDLHQIPHTWGNPVGPLVEAIVDWASRRD